MVAAVDISILSVIFDDFYLCLRPAPSIVSMLHVFFLEGTCETTHLAVLCIDCSVFCDSASDTNPTSFPSHTW